MYKLVESKFEKLKFLHDEIHAKHLKHMTEYDFRQFKTAEEVSYLR